MTKAVIGQAMFCGFFLLPYLSAEPINRGDHIQINRDSNFEAETVDDNITLDFADFQETSQLLSKLGKINVSVPEDSQLHLSLSSTLKSVKTDLPVLRSLTGHDDHRLKGYIGASRNHLTAHSGDGLVQVVSR